MIGAMWPSPDGASQFQYPGVGKVARRHTASAALFFWMALAAPSPGRDGGGLPEAIAIARRLGHLLDFPEQPHKSSAEADDDSQKQQRQAGGCQHGVHP